jgi:hypothetical protein
LRAADALKISLVAEIDGRVVGHIAFSPVRVSDGATDWYGFGPVSVLPDYQKQGIGKSLINKGLSLLKEMGGQGCALVGELNYYKRFGFRNYPELVHEGIPQEVFLISWATISTKNDQYIPLLPNSNFYFIDSHQKNGGHYILVRHLFSCLRKPRYIPKQKSIFICYVEYRKI